MPTKTSSLENAQKLIERFIERGDYLEMPFVIPYMIIVVIIFYIIGKLVEMIIDLVIDHRRQLSGRDTTRTQFIKHLIKGLIVLLGVIYAIYTVPTLRSYSKSLLAGAGLLAVAVGFASQAALANIVGGIFIVIYRPFRVKDHLTLLEKDIFGIVDDITLRHTVLITPENRKVVVPNALINNQMIKNSSLGDPAIFKNIEVLVAYNTDLDLALSIMNELIATHPLCIDRRNKQDFELGEPKVTIKVIKLEENGVRLRAWAWAANNNDAFSMTCDINKQLVERFRAANIEIPVPQRVIINRSN